MLFDVILILNHILEEEILSDELILIADMNSDGNIDILDIIGVVNLKDFASLRVFSCKLAKNPIFFLNQKMLFHAFSFLTLFEIFFRLFLPDIQSR